MNEITVTVDSESYTVAVTEYNARDRAILAVDAPDELIGIDPSGDIEVTPSVIDYLQEILVDATNFSDAEVDKLRAEALVELGVAVTNEIFTDTVVQKSGRLRRVRVTDKFIEHLFSGEAALIAGMPDDVTFEDFSYDPSQNELVLTFSSDAWERVDDGTVPYHETYGVELTGDTKVMGETNVTDI